MLNDKEYVLRQIEERDIHFVRLWFTDILGNLKSMAVTDSEIENALECGMGFDGNYIPGYSNVEESDMLVFPIASTFQVLPWRPRENGVARMFCEVQMPGGRPFEGDPRHILRKVVAKARDMGFAVNVGTELEYYYFESEKAPEPIDMAGYFDLTSADHASDLRRSTILTLEKMSIPVEYSHHEFSPSQQEIDLRYCDALSMADSVMTYRLVVKEIALSHGVYATFMPMPRSDYNGSGMHMHQSLCTEDGANAFFDAGDPDGLNLSETAKRYIAGLLKYAPEYMVLTNQYVNSYKRLASGEEAPSFACWGRSNRSAMIRIPGYRMGDEASARAEIRVADPAANPYLAFAATVASGLRGIEEGLELSAPCDGMDMARMSPADVAGMGVERLPHTLSEALDRFEASEFMRELLGEHTFDFLLASKRAECAEFDRTVTGWEIDRYLSTL